MPILHDLPEVAWATLTLIEEGRAPGAKDSERWVQAFLQAQWLYAGDSGVALSDAGRRALSSRSAEGQGLAPRDRPPVSRSPIKPGAQTRA